VGTTSIGTGSGQNRKSRLCLENSAADRASATGPPYGDVQPFMESILTVAPDRTLWGTDFPHPNITGPAPSKEALVDLLHRAAGDAATLRRVLVDNPDRLYRFST